MLATLTFLAAVHMPIDEHRRFKDRGETLRAPHLRAAVRVGANQDTDGSRQEICIGLAPSARWSLESCGTGAGFFGPASSGPDLAHFRLRYQAWSRSAGAGWLLADFQAGFAELEIGDDDPGFHFTSAGPRGLETAGPSAGASLRWTQPLQNALYVFGEINGNLVYFHHAAQLIQPQSPWHPSLSLSLGLGF